MSSKSGPLQPITLHKLYNKHASSANHKKRDSPANGEVPLMLCWCWYVEQRHLLLWCSAPAPLSFPRVACPAFRACRYRYRGRFATELELDHQREFLVDDGRFFSASSSAMMLITLWWMLAYSIQDSPQVNQSFFIELQRCDGGTPRGRQTNNERTVIIP